MKLLASLLGCAAADYACCPYDDFGVVNPGCPLSEKTPWAMQNGNANADAGGVSDHSCKAWEANIDATMEGNEDQDDWGGCGFQRHFPWGITDAQDGGARDLTLEHCKMGVFDCDVNNPTMSNGYKTLQLTGVGINIPLETGGFSAGTNNHVFGEVTLGGVCKLFIPVALGSIDSVSIAGVHMNGGGTITNNNGKAAVFDAAVCNTGDCSGTGVIPGTAYCFSVVNIGEFMENRPATPGAAGIMNANVAGKDQGGNNPITLDGATSEGSYSVDFGQSIEPTVPDGGSGTLVDVGANFDVVVHFKSVWCIRHWDIVQMQSVPDVGSLDSDYPLQDNAGVPDHAHSDVADKRFMAGMCGCGDGTDRHDANSGGPAALGCGAVPGCTDINSYAGLVPGGMKWPNAGAWAAYYSFISCANSDFMIYDVLNGITAGTQNTTPQDRVTVHSMFYNDIRHDYSNNHGNTGTIVIRGNIRQVGEVITNCGPGQVPTSDSKRCTWNWNFSLNGGKDAETWMERTNPESFAVWGGGNAFLRGDEADALPSLITTILHKVQFTMTFADDSDASSGAGNTHAFTLDAPKYFSAPSPTLGGGTAGNAFAFEMYCLQSSADGTGSQIITSPADKVALGDTGDNQSVRDIFPDCYMGDEIHFEYQISGGPGSNAADSRISAWYSHSSATFATL